jgi:sortase A
VSGVRRTARLLSGVFLALGVIALGYATYVSIETRVYQRTEARRFEQAREVQAAADAVASAAAAAIVLPRVPVDGESLGEIVIERLGIHVIVAQGDSDAILARAVGHLPATALPGLTGNVVLAAHRDTFFRPLKDVRVGDAISLKTYRGDFDYVVESTQVVKPTDVWVLKPTGGQTLTLVTCFPFYYVGAAPNRFIVRARVRSAQQL